jgi:hypothetical protein
MIMKQPRYRTAILIFGLVTLVSLSPLASNSALAWFDKCQWKEEKLTADEVNAKLSCLNHFSVICKEDDRRICEDVKYIEDWCGKSGSLIINMPDGSRMDLWEMAQKAGCWWGPIVLPPDAGYIAPRLQRVTISTSIMTKYMGFELANPAGEADRLEQFRINTQFAHCTHSLTYISSEVTAEAVLRSSS